MDGVERRGQNEREREIKTKLSSDEFTCNAHWEQREGQGRINGCAVIDKLIKHFNTHTDNKLQTECKCRHTLEQSQLDGNIHRLKRGGNG